MPGHHRLSVVIYASTNEQGVSKVCKHYRPRRKQAYVSLQTHSHTASSSNRLTHRIHKGNLNGHRDLDGGQIKPGVLISRCVNLRQLVIKKKQYDDFMWKQNGTVSV